MSARSRRSISTVLSCVMVGAGAIAVSGADAQAPATTGDNAVDCSITPLPRDCVTEYVRADPALATTKDKVANGRVIGVELSWDYARGNRERITLDRPTPIADVRAAEAARARSLPQPAAAPRSRRRLRQTYSSVCVTSAGLDILTGGWVITHYVRGNHGQWCAGGTSQSLTGYLDRLSPEFRVLDVVGVTGVPGFIAGYTRYDCNHQSRYFYEAESVGAVYVNGWIVGPPAIYIAGHTCPS